MILEGWYPYSCNCLILKNLFLIGIQHLLKVFFFDHPGSMRN